MPEHQEFQYQKIDNVKNKKMPTALVLMKVRIGGEREVLNHLKQIEEVKDSCLLFGVYDIFAKVEAMDRQRVEEIIIHELRKIDKVRETTTLWVLPSSYFTRT